MHRLLVVPGQGMHNVLFYKRGHEALGLTHCISGNQDEVGDSFGPGCRVQNSTGLDFARARKAAIRSRVALLWDLTGK